jgi:enoyl-CoA hydratase
MTAPSTTPSIRLEHHGAVRHLVLAAPERLNALNRDMLDEMAAAIATVAADPDARALVVRAEGRAFCAGADVTSLFGDLDRPPAEIRPELQRTYASFLGLTRLTIPTIAAVGGVAVGAGANIAFACDIAIVGPRARFVISFADIGLHPGGGCTWFLTQRLGAPRAMAAVLGALTIGAEEARDTGLVSSYADDPEAAAIALAEQCAARPAELVRDMKRTVQLATTGSLDEVVELESWAQASSATRPRFAEYVDSFARRD